MTKHGGKRPGAGRPAGTTKPDKRPMLQVRVAPATLEWFTRQAELNGMKLGRWFDKLADECRKAKG